jgi:Tfp pilus assembly protein PilX
METAPDYSAFKDIDNDSTMAQLTKLARAQVDAEAAVADAEAQLLLRQNALREISEKQLPELMDSLGLEEFTTTEGRRIGITEDVRASIVKDREQEAFTWLRDIGSGKMIKRAIGVQLAMGQDEVASKVKAALAAMELDVSDKQSVHNSTLVAFVRRRLKAGEEVPLDKIGVFRQRRSKVESPE